MPLPACLVGNLRIPVIGAPMFIVSCPELVIEQCKAGIVGSFPALNARPQGALNAWLTRIGEELAAHAEENPDKMVAPFAVNQIVHKSNDRLMADMETCIKHKVPIIITSLRPPAEIVMAILRVAEGNPRGSGTGCFLPLVEMSNYLGWSTA